VRVMDREKILGRLEELQLKFTQLPRKYREHGSGYYFSSEDWIGLSTSCQHLIISIFGKNSIHAINIKKAVEKCNGYAEEVNTIAAILVSAQDDFKGGYLSSVEKNISGEIFGDFVGMARVALSEGHKNVAAVLAAAALEDSIKRFCKNNEIEVQDKSLQDLVNAMKSKSLLSGSKKSLLDSMPRIRDNAMHANWDKISEVDVGAMIGFLDQFLISEF
jgi:hypothetical protein